MTSKTKYDKSYYITKGEYCYSCKSINKEFDEMKMFLSGINKDNFHLCLNCSRESSIKKIKNGRNFDFKLKLKQFVLSKKFTNIYRKISIPLTLLILVDVIFFLVKFDVYFRFYYLTNLMNAIYWMLNVYKIRISKIKTI